jgi:hypothetical protein
MRKHPSPAKAVTCSESAVVDGHVEGYMTYLYRTDNRV